MEKMKEVLPTPTGKVGWETEAWFSLERAAESTDGSYGRAMVVKNLGQSKILGWGDPANDEPGWEVAVEVAGITQVDRRQLSKKEAYDEFEKWLK